MFSLFGKKPPVPPQDAPNIVLGLLWCLEAHDLSNIQAMQKLAAEGRTADDFNFGTTRTSAHGAFWLKLVDMGLAREKPPGVDVTNEAHKNIAAFSPTPQGMAILLDALPAANSGRPPKAAIMTEAAVEMLRRYADEGRTRPQTWLGFFHEKGLGTPVNGAEAVKCYTAAAEKGDVIAMDFLAEMHFHGRGTPENLEEAFRWFRKAADHGNFLTMYKLGHIYTNMQDLPQAYIWYSLALKNGAPSSPLNDIGQYRKDTAAKLTPQQVEEADKFIDAWKPTGPLDPPR